jgi:RNA polymerase sigma factor (TIGR02999 family)
MRHILVDYARSKSRDKRGGWQDRVTFVEDAAVSSGRSEEIIALDDALDQLAALDARKVRVVEMKFFGGLKAEEIAGVLHISPETVNRDWNFAKTWLLRELGR